MTKMNTTVRPGYTLIEIMVSVTLSLLLLLGVTQMFRNVGDTINETQATLNMGANLNTTAMVLRNDLGGIIPALAQKAENLANGTIDTTGGYFEIIEGTGAPPNVLTRTANITAADDNTVVVSRPGRHISPQWTAYSPDSADGVDLTVTDNDDILAFTVNQNGNFRGLVNDGSPNGKLVENEKAEITWFVRGTNLYRRVLLAPDPNEFDAYGVQLDNKYTLQDLSIQGLGGSPVLNQIADLDHRENRFGRPTGTNFPYPIFPTSSAGGSSWYYLRMPTVEETVHPSWGYIAALTRTSLQCGDFNINKFPDLSGNTWGDQNCRRFWNYWDAPNGWSSEDGSGNRVSDLDPVTGSICRQPDPINAGQYLYVQNPRSPRAGEDIILTNVIGFDVKVWNPYWVPCYDPNDNADVTSVPNGDPRPNAANNQAWKWAPPQFVDLGQDQFYLEDGSGNGGWYPVNYRKCLDPACTNHSNPIPTGVPSNQVGYGFTLKGRYNTVLENTNTRRVDPDAGSTPPGDEWHRAERVENPAGSGTYQIWSVEHLACVYDSWSYSYMDVPSGGNASHLPPYGEAITGIQVTIRCFEPQSGTIKQIRITRFFN